MPVTRREQDPAEGARGKQLSEPPLHRLRGSLVGTRHEFLKTAAFAAVFTVSLWMIAGGAGLLSPDNQFYADARAALHGLAGDAASQADAAGARIRVAAASAADSVTDRVSGAIAVPDSGPAPAAGSTAKPPARHAAPAVSPAAANQRHLARVTAPAQRKVAHHRHHGAETAVSAPAPAVQYASTWSPDGVVDKLSDKFTELYYSAVNFFAQAFTSASNSARYALDSFTQMVGMNSEPATFDVSHPETVLEILSSTSTLMMLLGIVLFLIVAGVFVMSVKDGLRNASRRLRTRRSGGYA